MKAELTNTMLLNVVL